MKKYILILFCLFFISISNAQFEKTHEYGHVEAKNAIGFWTCKSFNDTHLIDVAKKRNNGILHGCFHELGRKNRLIIDTLKWTSHIDTFGEDRMSLNLNGGFAYAGGICYDCDFIDAKNKQKDFTFSFWAKRTTNSFGTLLSWGSEQVENGWLVYNSLDSTLNNPFLHLQLFRNGSVQIEDSIAFPQNEWNLFILTYDTLKKEIQFTRKVSETLTDESKILKVNLDSIRMGYSGFLSLGKNEFNQKIMNSGLSIDDIGVWNKRFAFNLLEDYGLNNQKTKIDQLFLSPNPTKDYISILNQSDLRTYSILNLLGQPIKTANLESNRIPVNFLPSGTYLLQLDTKNGRVQMPFVKCD